ncbi:phosphatase PAP2 family protein [Pseudorhodoferax sp.]|uniref:phosphatase PAP2 family protein n=1 Tax=Pseudorhodoferax sp. TaxID=1993553 RepID=UPI002DD680A5|nr:phosphatase PAP2 family protein [Pseudorhodoferax sp.]
MSEDALQAQALAEWLGQHALAAAGCTLLGLLAAVALAFAALRRLHLRVAPMPLPPLATFGLWLALGAGVVLAAAALFAETMEAMQADEELGVFDTRLAEVLAQGLAPQALRVVGTATHLGDPIVLTALVVLVGAALLWRGRQGLALGWVVACAGNGVLNQLLKQIFARVRPLHEHGFAVADGYSFPSGHTSGSVVVYGMLAYLGVRLLPPRWHLPGVLLAAALAFCMGVSRVLLQVHWASDVLAGFASGLAWLAVCVVAIEMRRGYARGVSTA